MIKAVIFDFGNVILKDTDQILFNRISEELNVDKETAIPAIKELVPKLQTGKMTNEEFWKKLCSKLEVSYNVSYQGLWTRGLQKVWKRIDYGMEGFVLTLKKSRYKTALLSNTIKPHVDFCRKRGFYDMFDPVVLSCEVGYRKPYIEIYKLTLDLLKLSGEECVYIDDKIKFLEPASNLGMRVTLFKDKTVGQLKEELIQYGVKST